MVNGILLENLEKREKNRKERAIVSWKLSAFCWFSGEGQGVYLVLFSPTTRRRITRLSGYHLGNQTKGEIEDLNRNLGILSKLISD